MRERGRLLVLLMTLTGAAICALAMEACGDDASAIPEAGPDGSTGSPSPNGSSSSGSGTSGTSTGPGTDGGGPNGASSGDADNGPDGTSPDASEASTSDSGGCSFQSGTVLARGVGTTVEAQYAAQSVADYAAAATAEVAAVLDQCTAIAKFLSASPADQSAADANVDPQAKLKAWCDLAVASMQQEARTSGAVFHVSVGGTFCAGETGRQMICQLECTGACDAGCGGCASDCTVTAWAKTDCSLPGVFVTAGGGADATATEAYIDALKTHLPFVVAHEIKLGHMANIESAVSGVGSDSIAPACLTAVTAAATRAVSDVTAALSAADEVLAAAGASP